jgi:gamma-glutamyltranspeptidase / glutathione hydrolase
MRKTGMMVALMLVIALVLAFAIGCEPAVDETDGIDEDDLIAENGDEEEEEEPEPHVEAVVSSHYLATEAGMEILEAGGTAADAAIGVAAVMTVVEPFFSSVLGGGTWALYYNAQTGEVTSQDGVGPVGSHATVEDYSARGGQHGMHQSVVPGAWDGWMLWLDEYGVMDLDEVLAPAIRIAREGFPVSGSMAGWIDNHAQLIAGRPDAARIYMPQGSALREGETIYQRDLADTLEDLANVYAAAIDRGRSEAIQEARDHFYRGPYAEAIVEYSDSHGGYLAIEDFNNFEAKIVEPISIQYNGELEVFQNPPNSQGITQLLALNILKGYDFSGYSPDDPEALHLQIEAVKLAFADRYHYIGDPARVDIPVDRLLSDAHAASQRERISMDSVLSWPIEGELELGEALQDEISDPMSTTTFHVVDRQGNAAAVTTSLGAQFMVIGDTGIHINNRMRMISIADGDPNQLTPGYKVRHTSNPYMVLRNGRPYIMGGNTGADIQPQGQVQQFMFIVEFGLSAQEAVDRPRFYTTSFPAGTFPYAVDNRLLVHQGFSSATLDALRAIGHNVSVGGVYGSANVLVVDEGGFDAQAGAEPRDDTSSGIVRPAAEQ